MNYWERNILILSAFFYRPSEENRLEASVSFHITEKEKKDVLNAINLPNNQQSLERLIEKLNSN